MPKLTTIKNAALVTLAVLLSACNGFFEKDNTPDPRPLTQYSPEVAPIQRWGVKTGSGTGDEYLKMSPGIGESAIYTASVKGVVTSVNKANGRINWQVSTGLPLTTGVGVGDGIVVAASRRGDVVALRQSDGRTAWKVNVPGEILAKPAVGYGEVIIKAIDGYIRAYATDTGRERWAFQQVEPNLILRGASSPLIRDKSVIIGFANGNLAKVGMGDGQLYWMHTLAVPEGAFAIQRMIDVDADPVVYDHHIYAVTYQGQIASLDWISGKVVWSQDLSSFTGMTADGNAAYVSDAKSFIWAFAANTGQLAWTQTNLEYRTVSGPALMGGYLVVGDGQGYLHWLRKSDGRLAGRVSVGSAIYAAPIVENNVLYALTNNGYLAAYTLR